MPPTSITRQPGLTKFLTDLVVDLRGLDTKSASPTEMLCIADNGISAVSLVASLMARRKLSAEAVAGYHLVGKVCALGTSAIAEVAGTDTLNSHFDPWFSTVDPDAYRTVGGGTLQTFHSELCVVLSEQVFEQVLFDKRARKPVSAAAELCGMLLRSIWVLLNAPEERAATTEFLEEVLACDLRILLKHRPWSNREL